VVDAFRRYLTALPVFSRSAAYHSKEMVPMIRFAYLFSLFLLLPCVVMARPVSYPGGVTIMQMNDSDANTLHVHYSPSVKYSIGYKGEYWRDSGWKFHGVQLNNLLKRWNAPASQANFYLKSGLGVIRSDKDEFAAFSGIAFDWEDRQKFFMYENRVYRAGDLDQFFSQKIRLGITPYIGDYGDLHTWLMLQVDHRPEANDNITITPIIRFFKSDYLTEIGISEDGDALLNFIIRF